MSGVLGKLAPTVSRSEFVKAWIVMLVALMLPAAAMAEEFTFNERHERLLHSVSYRRCARATKVS